MLEIDGNKRKSQKRVKNIPKFIERNKEKFDRFIEYLSNYPGTIDELKKQSPSICNLFQTKYKSIVTKINENRQAKKRDNTDSIKFTNFSKTNTKFDC